MELIGDQYILALRTKSIKNVHLNYPDSWWEGIPENWLTRDWKDYDTSINKYGVKVGTTLEDWEEKGFKNSWKCTL